MEATGCRAANAVGLYQAMARPWMQGQGACSGLLRTIHRDATLSLLPTPPSMNPTSVGGHAFLTEPEELTSLYPSPSFPPFPPPSLCPVCYFGKRMFSVKPGNSIPRPTGAGPRGDFQGCALLGPKMQGTREGPVGLQPQSWRLAKAQARGPLLLLPHDGVESLENASISDFMERPPHPPPPPVEMLLGRVIPGQIPWCLSFSTYKEKMIALSLHILPEFTRTRQNADCEGFTHCIEWYKCLVMSP